MYRAVGMLIKKYHDNYYVKVAVSIGLTLFVPVVGVPLMLFIWLADLILYAKESEKRFRLFWIVSAILVGAFALFVLYRAVCALVAMLR